MTDKHTNLPASYDDLELVTRYVQGHLDPEKVALVRQRLAEDPAFLDFAAPILLAWSVEPEWRRTPRPPGELEKHWDEFTRRAGFVHQRRKARRRRLWFLGIAILLAVPAWLALRQPLAIMWWRAGFSEVAAGDSVVLADGVVARLDSGARLEVHRNYMKDTARFVWLQGGASFTVPAIEPVRRFYVISKGGLAYTMGTEFRVRELGDTTEVLGGPEGAEGDDHEGVGGMVYLAQHNVRADNQQVFWGERARVAPGMPVIKKPRIVERPVATAPAAPTVTPAAAPKLKPPVLPRALPRLRIAELGDAVIEPHRRHPRLGERIELPMGVRAYADSGSPVTVHDPGNFAPGQLLGLRTGAALFLVPRDTTKPGTFVTWIGTRAGFVAALAPVAVAIWMVEDTMMVRVHRHVSQQQTPRDPFFGEHRVQLKPVLIEDDRPQFFLEPGQTGRMVRGQHPERVP